MMQERFDPSVARLAERIAASNFLPRLRLNLPDDFSRTERPCIRVSNLIRPIPISAIMEGAPCSETPTSSLVWSASSLGEDRCRLPRRKQASLDIPT